MKFYPDFDSLSKAELTSAELCENFAIRTDLENLFVSMYNAVNCLERYEELYDLFDSSSAKNLHDKAVSILNMIAELKGINRYYKSAIITHQLKLEAQEFNRLSDDQNA